MDISLAAERSSDMLSQNGNDASRYRWFNLIIAETSLMNVKGLQRETSLAANVL